MVNYNFWETLCNKSIKAKQKAISSKLNLKFLNAEVANGIHARLLMELFGNHIYKIKAGCVFENNGNKDLYEYGHIKIDRHQIRLSSCLDLEHQIITYPIEEQQYLNRGQFLYFTNGDLYLVLINNLLDVGNFHSKTELRNYQLHISSLFEMKAVYKCGLIDLINESFEDENGIHKITKQLPQNYVNLSLRGCMQGAYPHWILARLENSGSEAYFNYELWTTLKDITNTYKDLNISFPQILGTQARRNTKELLNKEWRTYRNIVVKRPGILKTKEQHWMIFDYRQTQDIEKIRQYCHSIYERYLKK